MTKTLALEADWKDTEENKLAETEQTGQAEAFSELVRRYQPACLKIARSMLRHPEQAEDETKNSFYKAFLHLHQFRHGSKFSTLLTRIVINQC